MKAKVFIGTSLDGFIARKNGDISWLEAFASNEVQEAYTKFARSIDVFVIGRGTYEKVLEFPEWPYDKPVFLLSNTINKIPGQLTGKVELSTLAPKDLLQHLAAKNFNAAYVDGGKVIQSFLRDDLIDELIISVVPIIIGDGLPLFGNLQNDLQFTHTATETQTNGLVRNFYVRTR